MKTIILISLSTLFFSPASDEVVNRKDNEEASKTSMKLEIELFNEIIQIKLSEADLLEKKAKMLLEEDSNSETGAEAINQAKLVRMMTFKYRAAIACRVHLLE